MNSNNSNNANSNNNKNESRQRNNQRRQQHRNKNKNKNNKNNDDNTSKISTNDSCTTSKNDIILVLHGNQQTGQLLLGRIERLTKRLKKEFDIETIAPDAPHLLVVDNNNNNNNNHLLRTWWNRDENNNYIGLEDSLEVIHQTVLEMKMQKKRIIGILGFSQGARFTHLLAQVYQKQKKNPEQNDNDDNDDCCCWFPYLQFVTLVAGYDATTPSIPFELFTYFQYKNKNNNGGFFEASTGRPIISLSSLHIWGSNDTLVTPDQSEALSSHYIETPIIKQIYVHPGRHHVPTKGSEIHIYIDFIRKVLSLSSSSSSMKPLPSSAPTPTLVEVASKKEEDMTMTKTVVVEIEKPMIIVSVIPDEDIAAMQQEEVQALEIIYPDNNAIQLISGRKGSEEEESIIFDFPIVYRIKLNDIFMEEEEEMDNNVMMTTTTNWPKQPLTIEIRYPVSYPSDDDDNGEQHQNNDEHCLPIFELIHNNTVFEFPSVISEKLLNIIRNTAIQERGMPCVLSCLYAARKFLDSDRDNELWDTNNNVHHTAATTIAAATNAAAAASDANTNNGDHNNNDKYEPLIRKSTSEEIQKGILEGLDIAQSILSSLQQQQQHQQQKEDSNVVVESGGGGSFGTSYTIGLVGKPSAGKSTFFNAATGFSRQRGQQQQQQNQKQAITATTTTTSGSSDETSTKDESKILGGASMAAHPFTTIDPNIGYCLIPAPFGSCPEDDNRDDDQSLLSLFGSTHGRDPNGRRFIPVQLKDVAGLVPGAYQGKGRGNQFLNDLTDATVLIHVVDSSGSADSSGNKIIIEEEEKVDSGGGVINDTACTELYQRTNPIDDLKWIRSELVEWVYSNLIAKWDIIIRKGRSKLVGMFSGYGQREVMIDTIFNALDKYLDDNQNDQQQDQQNSTPISLDRIDLWSECDIHRLVSLFLGVRFPMALALNKTDLSSAKQFVKSIQDHLPIHGASVGTPVSAKKEMKFVKEHMLRSLNNTTTTNMTAASKATAAVATESSPVSGVWNCLSSAIELRLPILVFPVGDIITWEPMPGMNKLASGKNPSLPNKGMINCIVAAGGTSPTCWNAVESNFSNNKNTTMTPHKLRDVILMKPGSTVEDVFLTLNRLGAVSGEFVRAEACSGDDNEKPKPIPKNDIICRKNRIIKIMTNKRTQWQNNVN